MNSKRKQFNSEHPKDFDSVDFMRKRREEIAKETENMTPEEEIAFVREKFVEYERTKRN